MRVIKNTNQIREACQKKTSKNNDIYQKGGGVESEFYENKFLICNCDITLSARTCKNLQITKPKKT